MADAGARIPACSTRSTSSTSCARHRPACSCSPRATSPDDLQPQGALGAGPACRAPRRRGAGGRFRPRASHRCARSRRPGSAAATPRTTSSSPPAGRRRSPPACAASPLPAAPWSSSRRPTSAPSPRPAPPTLPAVPVPSDEDGRRLDLLADALDASGARLVYVQSSFANPHGVTLAPARRAAVLEAVRAAGERLIEDEAAPRSGLRPGDAACAAGQRRPRRPRRPPHLAHQGRRARPAHRRTRRPRARPRPPPGRAGTSRTSTSPARSRRPRSSSAARPPGSAT